MAASRAGRAVSALFLLALWGAALFGSAVRFNQPLAPKPRVVPAAAEPVDDTPPEPRAPAYDESTEPTPV